MTSAPRDYIKREGIVNSVSIKARGRGSGEQDAVLVAASQESHFGATGAAAGFGWAELFPGCCIDLGWSGGFSCSVLVDGGRGFRLLIACVPVSSLVAFPVRYLEIPVAHQLWHVLGTSWCCESFAHGDA